MIGFGLRLTLRGGREAAVRLVVTAMAVAVGVGLLLATLAAINGAHTQNARYAWLNSGIPGAAAADAVPSPDPLWATLATDLYQGQSVTRVDVAATGPRSPVPPGIPRLPEAGEYYASPAMSALLRTAPDAELGDRYPGSEIGTIGAAALPAPDSLILVIGHRADELSQQPHAAQVTSIATEDPGACRECRVGTDADGMALVLSVTSAALILPVLIFIGTATRLDAARREQRFAAMRLVGATPRQVSVVSAVESTVAAVVGTGVGFVLFFLLRIPLASVAFTGERFFPGDLSLGAGDVLLVALGVPLAAAIAARIALRRVRISPLGVSRRATPRPPRAYRLIPLIAGVGELAWFVGRRPESTDGQIWAYLSGIVLMMVGLVIAGPWLTMAGARFLARHTSRPATLIAGRRLADDPKAGFRAVSGLVLALFVTSTAVGVMTTILAERGQPTGDAAARNILAIDFSRNPVQVGSTAAPIPDAVVSDLSSLSGVRGVAVIHENPLGTEVPIGPWSMGAGLVSCEQFAALAGLGRCAAGAEAASVPPDFTHFDASDSEWGTRTWPAAAISADELRSVPARGLVVGTSGSSSVIERTRTALTAAFPSQPYQEPPATIAEFRANSGVATQLAGFQQLTTVVVLGSLCIAGCGLAVSVVGGLNARKRPFSLLRLTGVPLSLLRRIVVLESAVPLLVVAVVATGAGFLAAQLFLESQLDYSLRAPGVAFYIAVVGGLTISLVVIASALPLISRITGPDTARNE